MKRSSRSAVLLSLLYPGLGQFYNDQVGKASVFLTLAIISVGITIATYGIWGFSMLIVWVWSVVDAAVTEDRLKGREAESGLMKERKSRKPAFLAGILLWAASIFGFTAYTDRSPEEKARVRSEVEQSLQQKYHREFQVTKLSYGAESKVYTISAHVKDDPDISFQVWRGPDHPEISDEYPEALWSSGAKAELRPLIDRLYGDQTYFAINVEVKNRQDHVIEEQGNVFNYEEIRTRYKDILSQSVLIGSFAEMTESKQQQESEKIWQLIQHYREKGIAVYLQIEYFKPELVSKLAELQESGLMNFHNKYDKSIQYACIISPEQSRTIHSADQVESFLRRISH